jgi:hypothetical protein
VAVEGVSLRPDHDANTALCGREVDPEAILVENAREVPAPALSLIQALRSGD